MRGQPPDRKHGPESHGPPFAIAGEHKPHLVHTSENLLEAPVEEVLSPTPGLCWNGG